MLVEKYFLIVYGESFEKGTIKLKERPNDDKIIQTIKELNGKSARVEKRYVLKEDE